MAGRKKEFDATDGKIGLPSVGPGINKLPPKKRIGGGKGAKSDKDDSRLGVDGDDIETTKLLERIRKRMDRCISHEKDNRQAGLDDKKFLSGEGQWPADVAAQRNFDRRPCLVINKLPTFVNQITNDQRQNRPSINVSPVGDGSDPEVAKFYRGMIRNIERNSAADIAYDSAFADAASIGWGYWLVTKGYESDKSFNQVLRIDRIRNVFTVYLDPDAQDPTGADAKFAIISNMMTSDEFKEKYPNSQTISFDMAGQGEKLASWMSKDQIRVAEYYEVKNEMRDLVALSNGWVGWKEELSKEVLGKIASGELEIQNERESPCPKVTWYKVTAVEVLEKTDITCSWIPIVRVIGNELDVEGKVRLSGIVRSAKQSQMLYNYGRTTELEFMGLQPKAPFVIEEGQIEGHESEWKNANTTPLAALTYKGTNINGTPVPPPQRQGFPGAPAPIIQFTQTAAQDMMAVTGIRFDATKQERVIDESGRALREIRSATDLGSFHYIDNLSRSLKRCGEILIDWIPKVYDTKQIVTILREDDSEETVEIDPNAPKPMQEQKYPPQHPTKPNKIKKIFNPTIGKYGVTVTIGPNYATKRIEAAESMMDFIRAIAPSAPQAASAIVDLVAKNCDWPGGEETAARLAKIVAQQHPGIMTPDMRDVPPQVSAMLSQMQQQIQQLTQERMQMQKALTDQQADRAQRQDEIDKTFEAKMAKIVADIEAKSAATQEKAISNYNTHIGAQIKELGQGVTALIHQIESKGDGDVQAQTSADAQA